MANRFRRRVAEYPLCSEIPGADDAIQRFADDRVVGGCYDGGQPRVRRILDFALIDVDTGPEPRVVVDSRVVGWLGPTQMPAEPAALTEQAAFRFPGSYGPDRLVPGGRGVFSVVRMDDGLK
jgi:hypothetical protein